MRRAILSLAAVSALVLALPSLAGASVGSDPREERPQGMLDAAKRAAASHSGSPAPLVADNFQVLGHANLGGGVPNGDVWFYDHGGAVGKFAYVGTWSAQCTGQGAKIAITANGIEIDNGKGASIKLSGTTVSVNGGALEVT